jgi:hypothetical protein
MGLSRNGWIVVGGWLLWQIVFVVCGKLVIERTVDPKTSWALAIYVPAVAAATAALGAASVLLKLRWLPKQPAAQGAALMLAWFIFMSYCLALATAVSATKTMAGVAFPPVMATAVTAFAIFLAQLLIGEAPPQEQQTPSADPEQSSDGD